MLDQHEDFSPELPQLVEAAARAAGDLVQTGQQSPLPTDDLAGLPLAQAAARMERAGGIRLFPERRVLAEKVQEGTITRDDISGALTRMGADAAGLSVEDVLAAMTQTPPAPRALPTVADLAGAATDMDWSGLVTERFGAWAQGHFNPRRAARGDATPPASWEAWRNWAANDLTPEIHGLAGFTAFAHGTPQDPWRAIGDACLALGIDRQAAPSFFERLLCDVWGWASLARDQAVARGDGAAAGQAVAQVLGIRLVWEQALHARFGPALDTQWQAALDEHRALAAPRQDHLIDAVLQTAAERASARVLDGHLRVLAPTTTSAAATQLVFTSDPRSERLRRALEGFAPEIRTHGVGDSFGLPPRDSTGDPAPKTTLPALRPAGPDQSLGQTLRGMIARVSDALVSSFALVQTAGPLQAGRLLDRALGRHASVIGYGKTPRLAVDPETTEAADIAEAALRRMCLTKDIAPLVVFVARDSRVWSAAQPRGSKSAWNARALAQLLNETPVRKALAQRGIEIDGASVFMAAVHDTVSDTVNLYMGDPVGDRYGQPVKRLRGNLERASALVRAERVFDLPGAETPADLLGRGGDWAETVTEAGAAEGRWFVIGPRTLTAGATLQGRAALHDYDAASDPDGEVLASLLSTEVLAAATANRQAYLAATAPPFFGSDSPVHVTPYGDACGLDGTSGRVSPGPSGEAVLSDPIRLIVRIAAPEAIVAKALAQCEPVARMVREGWIDLTSVDAAHSAALARIPASATRAAPARRKKRAAHSSKAKTSVLS